MEDVKVNEAENNSNTSGVLEELFLPLFYFTSAATTVFVTCYVIYKIAKLIIAI